MSSRGVLTTIACIFMLVAVSGQRTDNCTWMPKGFTLCGEDKCCCRGKRVICSGFGHELTYIPHLQQAIRNFRFVGNYLQYLNKKSFSNITTTYIYVLFLTNNGILKIPEDAFSNFVSVRIIYLDGNKLTKLSAKPFQSLKYLQRMILSHNNIRHIANDAIQQSIININLQYNELVHEILPSWFCSSEGDPIFPRLLAIDFMGNFITKLTNDSFKCLGTLRRMDFSKNVIETVDQNTFAHLYNLENISISHMRQSLRNIQNCAFNNSNIEYLSLREDYITFKPNLAAAIFQRSTNIRILHISLNNLAKLSHDQVLGMLRPLKKLEILHAERCRIQVLSVKFLSCFRNLTILNLSGNSIYTLVSFSNAYSLKYLMLSGNNINYIKEQDVSDDFMSSLESINLSNNPFECTCALLWFRSMIHDDAGKFGNISLGSWPYRYKCRTPAEEESTLLLNYKPTKLSCANVLEIALISLAVFLVVVAIVSTMTFRYRWYLKYWFYKLNTHVKHPETISLLHPENQAYDGYIIYNPEDSQFVHHDLLLLMEEKHGYKLHIWERNAPAGCTNLDGMVDGMHASENAIAVISRSSIQDSWIKFQMDVALDRQVELKKDFLILIILEDVEVKSLSKYWCVMLTRFNALRWCQDETDMKHAVFEHQMTNYLGSPTNSRVQ